MKKYTQPTVEITAFDFEDITMSSLGEGYKSSTYTQFTEGVAAENAAGNNLNVVVW